VAGQAQRWFSPLLIVALVSGCDNVEWGGADVRLEPPPPQVSAQPDSSESTPDTAAPPPPELPAHPVLFMGQRRGDRVELVPVAELTPEGPVRLPAEGEVPGFNDHWVATRFAPGTELTLLAAGTRAGTLTVQGAAPAENWCEERPALTGIPEVRPEAADTERFLAISPPGDTLRTHGPFRAGEDSYEQRVESLALANAALAITGARWPPAVLETRRDMQSLHLEGEGAPAFAATFVYRDRLGLGEPEAADAWAIFVLGEGGPVDYDMAHFIYRPTAEGKAAPRYVQHADWDGDGAAEIALETFGVDARGALLLDRTEDGWQEIFELSCRPPGAD
jgi:hypothetical protein